MHRKSAYILFLAVLGLLVIGIVMLFSTSAFARDSHGDVYFFIKRQAMWFGVGLVVCIFAALIDYHLWQRTWWLWFALALVVLALCYVPHIGMRLNGSRRWIGWGPITVQPSELAKLAIIFFLAAWFARYEKPDRKLLFGFILPLAIITLPAALVLGEVDLGTTALIGTTAFVVMFVAGANPLWLGIISLTGLGGLLLVATRISERMGRLSAFLHPQHFQEDAGLQQMQALIAWGSGGMEGLGLGNGRQKMLYLPYAHTDFIFPIVGEELGLRFSLLVVFLFVVIIVCGTMIALHAKDRFGLLLGCGVVSLLALQAAVNIGVTTSLLPNKGLPLPFISYGGSNLVACMFGVGLLLNIYRQGILEPPNKKHATMRARITPRI
ncbi:MAG: putative lipid II flippase FtsW [Verrucomicrobia bacterium]|nr:MAG: putative lipid II flippase FtsW [Verrucomicrobiota bacterium]PYK51223.1 MAG: putative lipid II flippase FtsW [Verrucomicrobiota bacterium]PYL42276.1 MAG: putative lipid II flippase FtsW [Verrucomicrobiota bacterium]